MEIRTLRGTVSSAKREEMKISNIYMNRGSNKYKAEAVAITVWSYNSRGLHVIL